MTDRPRAGWAYVHASIKKHYITLDKHSEYVTACKTYHIDSFYKPDYDSAGEHCSMCEQRINGVPPLSKKQTTVETTPGHLTLLVGKITTVVDITQCIYCGNADSFYYKSTPTIHQYQCEKCKRAFTLTYDTVDVNEVKYVG